MIKIKTRNIVKSGSSYVISLPQDWIKKNNLKKGDFLYLDEQGNKLTYSSQVSDEENKTIVLNIDGKSESHVEKMIKSAYLTNYHTFIFMGESIKDRVKELRSFLHQLVAVEIMEQTSSAIVGVALAI